MSPEEVLNQAFAVIEDQLKNEEWLLANRQAISDQIDEGFAQSERGELYDPEEAMRILRERRAKRQVACDMQPLYRLRQQAVDDLDSIHAYIEASLGRPPDSMTLRHPDFARISH